MIYLWKASKYVFGTGYTIDKHIHCVSTQNLCALYMCACTYAHI